MIIFDCTGSSLLHGLFSSCRGYSAAGVHRLLTVAASLVAEHGLQGSRLQWLQHEDSVVVVPGL